MPSPPKPWERGGSSVASAPSPTIASSTSTTTSAAQVVPNTTSAAPDSSTPTVPTRPPALTNPLAGISQNPAAGPSAYPGTSYSSPYSSYSPYNRFGSSYSPYGMGGMYGAGAGGMYSSSYSPYGGMGGMYGGGYGGYGGYGMGGMGMGMGMGAPGQLDPHAPPTLTQTLESTTSATFGLLHSIVQTFGGVAQMLESTFVATHSSFFAMVGVVDQLGHLRTALGSVLGLFGLVRWMRDLLLGRTGGDAMRGEFREFVQGRPVNRVEGPGRPRPSKKPLIFFLLAIFGVPYAMHHLVRLLVARQQEQQQGVPGALPPLDPSQLTFARAVYPFDASSPAELALKENEIVAVMGKLDPRTGAEVDPRLEVEGSEWWKGRTREGREGWFPRKWVQVLERRKPIEGPPADAGAEGKVQKGE